MALSQAELAALYEEDEPKKSLSQEELAALFESNTPKESSFVDKILSIPEDLSHVTAERIVKPAMRSLGMKTQESTPEMTNRAYGSYPASIANAFEDIVTGIPQLASYLHGPEAGNDLFGWTGMNKPVGKLSPGQPGYLAQAIRDRTKERRQKSEIARENMGRGSFDPLEMAAGMAVPNISAAGNSGKLVDLMIQSAKGGAFNAITMPTSRDDIGQAKVEQFATGGVLSGALPLIAKPFSWLAEQADQVIRPFSEKGIKKDVKDLLVKELGKERTRVVEAMMLADKDMTVGQALAKYAQETGDIVGAPLMKLEKELSQKGGEGVPLRDAYQNQQHSREKIINEIAGLNQKPRLPEDMIDAELPVSLRGNEEPGLDNLVNKLNPDESFTPYMTIQQSGGLRLQDAELIEDPLKRAQAIRNIKSEEAYGKAFAKDIDITNADQDFGKIVKNPFFRKAMPLAKDLSASKGITFDKNKTEYLHNIKLALDDMLKTEGKTALGSAEKKAVNDVKKELVSFIEKKNPFYKEARLEFQKLSEPINQMEVGRFLSEKLVNPTGNEAPGTFLRAAKDAPGTLKKSTGFSRYDELGDVMNPEQVSGINRVVSALERQALMNKGAGQVESVLPKLEAGIEVSLPNLLSRPALVANAVLRTIGKNKSPEYNRVATEIMRDPKKLAALLNDPQTSEIAGQIYQEISKVIGQTSGREIGK